MIISDIGEDKSHVDDLNREQGIVSSRVALLLRSAEIKPDCSTDLFSFIRRLSFFSFSFMCGFYSFFFFVVMDECGQFRVCEMLI